MVLIATTSIVFAEEKSATGWRKHVVFEGEQVQTAVAADFTGDGRVDVISNSGGKTRLFVGPSWREVIIGEGEEQRFIHAEVMDPDRDGDPDFVAARYSPGLIVWFERPEKPLTDAWKMHVIDREVDGIHGLLRGDIDGDGKLDLLANSAQPKGPFANSLVWLRVPNDPRQPWTRYVAANGDAPGLSHYLGVGDVNGDGRTDLASAAKGGKSAVPGTGDWFAWWEAPADPTKVWKKRLISSEERGATNIHPADVNGDGRTDFIASRGHGRGVLWFEAPDWEPHDMHETLFNPHCLVVTDMDGDGDVDAATCAFEERLAVWFENDGKGEFTTHTVGKDQAAYDIRAVDMDSDGDFDLLIAGQRSENVVWYESPLAKETGRALAPGGTGGVAAESPTWDAIDMGAFSDSIHHALMKYPAEKAPYERYRPEQIVSIAENLLAWQNPDGGWPANRDWLRVLSRDELAAVRAGENSASGRRPRTTLDNRNTWAQLEYLAAVYHQTGRARHAAGCVRALDYILREQRPSGGWRGSDVDAITFNDDVMVGVLRTLRTVAGDDTLYDFVDAARRSRARDAYQRGIECVLKCQIRVHGRLTAWCQQHSHEDFRPVKARAFEPASITAGESVGVVRLLMEIESPSPAVVRAIDAAVAWFEHVKIRGLRVDKVPVEPVQFRYHWCDFDRVEVLDPKAPPIWTRFYDLDKEEPLFCTRASQLTTQFTDVSHERRTGYAWHGYWPARLLAEEHPAWRQRLRSRGEL